MQIFKVEKCFYFHDCPQKPPVRKVGYQLHRPKEGYSESCTFYLSELRVVPAKAKKIKAKKTGQSDDDNDDIYDDIESEEEQEESDKKGDSDNELEDEDADDFEEDYEEPESESDIELVDEDDDDDDDDDDADYSNTTTTAAPSWKGNRVRTHTEKFRGTYKEDD